MKFTLHAKWISYVLHYVLTLIHLSVFASSWSELQWGNSQHSILKVLLLGNVLKLFLFSCRCLSPLNWPPSIQKELEVLLNSESLNFVLSLLMGELRALIHTSTKLTINISNMLQVDQLQCDNFKYKTSQIACDFLFVVNSIWTLVLPLFHFFPPWKLFLSFCALLK